ncbi:MAG: N-formylglutamate amidohydrolase [Sphingobium sp.]
MKSEARTPLLGPGDPAPVRVTNPDGRSSFLLIGDHAGLAIPGALGTLGLTSQDLSRHIACDIGVAGLGRRMAAALDACFIEQVYSRLVVDCNRAGNHADAFWTKSDGTVIPGNLTLTAAEREARHAAIQAPYQAAIAAELARRDAAGRTTILVSLHSFTPVMDGRARPWDVGILHDGGDARFAVALRDYLTQAGRFIIGDNQPYRMDHTDYTVPLHAYDQRRLYAELEIRQDHLADDSGQIQWAESLATALRMAERAVAEP